MLRSMPPVIAASQWPRHERVHRRVEGGEAGRAGGVGDEVRPAQVQHVGDAPGEDVGQLPRHRVLGDRRQVPLPDHLVPAGEDALAHVGGQVEELLRLVQPARRTRGTGCAAW